MKKALIFLFVLGTLVTTTQAQIWQPAPTFTGIERDDAATFTINDKHYVGTGLAPWFAALGDVHAFDTSTETWQAVASLPGGAERQYACGFASFTHGYFFGGLNDTNYLNDLWQYDPITDSWNQKTALPGLGRSGASCFVIGDTAYIFGGQAKRQLAIAEVWAYSFSGDSWHQKNDLPVNGSWRGCASSNVVAGYACFGKDSLGQISPNLYRYEPQNDTWQIESALPFLPRTYAGLVHIPNNLYFLMGQDSSHTIHNNLWRYSTTLKQWFQFPDFPDTPRRGGCTFGTSPIMLYYTTGLDSTGQRLKESYRFLLPVGLGEKHTTNNLLIFPNPAQSMLTLQVPNATKQWYWILFDMTGKILEEGRSTKNSFLVNTAELPAGTYLINVKYQETVLHQTFSITR